MNCMPGLVGGFGKNNYFSLSIFDAYASLSSTFIKKDTNATPDTYKATLPKGVGLLEKVKRNSNTRSKPLNKLKKSSTQLGPYLAGLIEGDGTFAIHDKDSTVKKYNPVIIIVFKKADLPLANYLQKLTNSGRVYIKPERGYVL